MADARRLPPPRLVSSPFYEVHSSGFFSNSPLSLPPPPYPGGRKAMATRKDRRRDQLPPVAEGSRGERNGAPPCPGDTLPWNLSKHQRVKRSKSSTGEVLDPADRAVIRIAGGMNTRGAASAAGAHVMQRLTCFFKAR